MLAPQTPTADIRNRKERSGVSTNPEDMRYFVSGRQIGELTNNGYEDPTLQNYAKSLVLRNRTDNPVATPFRWNTMSPSTGGNFGTSNGYNALNPYGDGAGTSGSSYTVRDGDTLQGIATSVWGDASLWYLLAEANGMADGSALIAGQSLAVPDRVTNAHNNAGTFDVYDPARALGDLNPTTPKPAKANKCGMMGQMLVMLVAVAVAALLPQVAPAVFKAGIFGAMATGAASSAASQAFGVATGIQDRFNWKSVALSTISAGIGYELGGVELIKGGGNFVNDAARGALGNVLSQGIGVATGLQDKFSWAGVAGAGVVAGVSGAATRGLTPRGAKPSFGAVQAGGAAGAFAGAAARSLITGTSFGDNIMAVLPDVIASTIGNALVAGVRGSRSDASDTQATETPTGQAGQDPAYSASVRHFNAAHGRIGNVQMSEGASYSPPALSDWVSNDNIVVTGHPVLSLISVLPGWLGDYSSFLRMSSSSNLWSNDSRYGVVGNMALTATYQARALFRPYMPHAPNHSARAFHSGPLALVESAARYHLGDHRVNTAIGMGRGFIHAAFNNRGGWRIDLKALGYGIYNYTIGPDSLYGRTIPPLFYNAAGAFGDLVDAGGAISIQSGLPQGRIGAGLRALARPFQAMRNFYQSTRAAPAAAVAERVAPGLGTVENVVIHGNSRLSPRTAYLYELVGSDGTFLKYGISQNPATRYSRTFMADKRIYPTASGTRAEMLQLERQLVTQNPGPLNFEPWAIIARLNGRGQ